MGNCVQRLIVLAVAIMCSHASIAQSVEADPAALKEFGELIKSYRKHPALRVKSTVEISVKEGEAEATGSKVECESTFAPGRVGVVTLQGYTCYLHDGKLVAVHKETDHSYFTQPDDGSPYYALMTSFIDLPFPELALALGEDDPADVLMQLHPKAPWLQPVAVREEKGDSGDRRVLELRSDHDVMTLTIDSKLMLVESAKLVITGGDMVREGTTLTYQHQFVNEIHEQALPGSTFEFAPGQRQRVDVLAALAPRPLPGEEDAENPDQPRGIAAGALVGKEAPPIILATAEGKAFDLEDERGRVVVLDYWASWCGPCLQALPKLHEVAQWARENELPVTVVTINVFEVQNQDANNPDARLASALKTWKAKSFTLPVVMDYTDQTATAYGVRGIPSTVVIRADGIVHAQHTGAGADYVEMLKSDIKAAMEAVEEAGAMEEEPVDAVPVHEESPAAEDGEGD